MPKEPSRNERIKEASRYLRGALAEGLAREITGAIGEEDQQLVKFHGMYLQDDRDLRAERRRKKMEAAFAFMIRVRIPGGLLTPSQYLALDEIGRLYAGNTVRITTRQTIRFTASSNRTSRRRWRTSMRRSSPPSRPAATSTVTSSATRTRTSRTHTPP
jgi:sulfite reductase (NADPH) hemoprotein beta-component